MQNDCPECDGRGYVDERPQGGGAIRCEYCGEDKIDGPPCRGNDQCIYGDDGGPALCCDGWAGMCCKCGYSYAVGQL